METLRKFLDSKEHLEWLNDTHRENFVLLNPVQEFIEIQAWLLLNFFHMFTQSINFCILYCHKIKECKCLKNAIHHQLERSKWLLLSVFQQGFRQKLSWSLSSHRKMLFLRGFILKPTKIV